MTTSAKNDASNEQWNAFITWQPVHVLLAPHEPDDPEKRKTIAASMKDDGWVGRPLLARYHGSNVQLGKPFECVTGSHRIAAACDAGLKRVPVVVVNCEGDLHPPSTGDLFEDILRYAENNSAAFASAVRALWDAEDYPVKSRGVVQPEP